MCLSVCVFCGGQGNPFLSALNGIGILGSGVLAALYASAAKEKEAANATIESVSWVDEFCECSGLGMFFPFVCFMDECIRNACHELVFR